MTFTASVSRVQLGLADLNINDHVAYAVSSDSILSGQVQMRRNTVQSSSVAGAFDVSAVPDRVQDVWAIEVLDSGTGAVTLQSNLKVLITAFQQLQFNLTFTWDAATYTYACQSSDYVIDWTSGRAIARQLLVKFSLYRSPVAINGV